MTDTVEPIDAGPGLRERKKARTRRTLVRHAVAMFAEQGFDATTIEDIAAATGCADRTVYRYFTLKEDLVFFDLPELLDELKTILSASGPNADPWETVTAALRQLSRHQTGSDPEITQARIRLWFTDPTLRSRYLELFQPWEATLADFLTQRSSGSTLDELNAQVTAASLLVAMRAAYRSEVLHGGDFDAYLDQAFTLLAGGMRNLTPSSRQVRDHR